MNTFSENLKKTLPTIGFTVFLVSSVHLAQANDSPSSQTSMSIESVKHQTVSLNQSSVEQLITLKGVGDNRAQAIISYRQQYGEFKSVNDLSKVSGIGEKIVKDNLTRLTL